MTDIREEVSKAYSNAIKNNQERKASASSGCCAPPQPEAQKTAAPPCCVPTADTQQKHAGVTLAADTAGYSSETDKYADAAEGSFGCGNPLAFSGVREGDTVVDLGSGAGFDLLIAADKVGASGRVIGIDMTDDMMEVAEKNIRKSGHANVELRKGFIEALPLEDSSVDWVISNCVINLSPDKPQVFKEISRVLKPGGQFSVSDIVVKELPQWLRDHSAAYTACIAGAISEEEYLDGLRQAGLEGVKVTERLVYEPDHLRAMIASDLSAFGIDETVLERGLSETAGKVWSVKVVGKKGVHP